MATKQAATLLDIIYLPPPSTLHPPSSLSPTLLHLSISRSLLPPSHTQTPTEAAPPFFLLFLFLLLLHLFLSSPTYRI
jgi:hypothetical protein